MLHRTPLLALDFLNVDKIIIMSRYLALNFISLLLISSCSTQLLEKQPKSASVQTPTTQSKIRIQQLLESANQAMAQNRLTTPKDDNALDKFKKVLDLSPSNPLAVEGINQIVERYLSWARDNVDRSQLKKARHFVSLAHSIDPDHPSITPIVININDQEDKIARIFELDSTSTKNQKVSPLVLNRIANKILEHRAFVTIRAPDDRSGRWLYQELNRRVDFRIEARLEISNKASVTLIFNGSGTSQTLEH